MPPDVCSQSNRLHAFNKGFMSLLCMQALFAQAESHEQSVQYLRQRLTKLQSTATNAKAAASSKSRQLSDAQAEIRRLRRQLGIFLAVFMFHALTIARPMQGGA